jgi:hypothetical protein
MVRRTAGTGRDTELRLKRRLDASQLPAINGFPRCARFRAAA